MVIHSVAVNETMYRIKSSCRVWLISLQGCGSSREARPEAEEVPTRAVPSLRTNNARDITSQTAINAPLSATTSRHQTRLGAGPSASIISSRRSQHQDPLSEHYNHPLEAPKKWSSTDRTWTRTQLIRERNEFFETRVTGHSEIWQALKLVAEETRRGSIQEAQSILDAAGITLPTGHIEDGAYDERGMLYKMDKEIISDPTNLVEDDDGETVVGEAALSKKLDIDNEVSSGSVLLAQDEKPDKGKDAIEKDAIKVKCRLSDRGGPDTIVLIGKTQTVNVLNRRLRSEATLPSSAKVRFFHLGKEMKDSQTLEEQGWQPGHVVQALVTNFGPSP